MSAQATSCLFASHCCLLMQAITGAQLDTAPDVLRLQHVLDSKMLPHRDEVEVRGNESPCIKCEREKQGHAAQHRPEFVPLPRCLVSCPCLACRPAARALSRQELCSGIVKEEQIEIKFNGVLKQWNAECFAFSDHKSRGPVLLKVRTTPGGEA